MWLCLHGNDSLCLQSQLVYMPVFSYVLAHTSFSPENCDTRLTTPPLYFKYCHHYECDFNTEGDKPTNIIVSLLLRIWTLYNIKLCFTLPFLSNDYNLHSFNKWSLCTCNIFSSWKMMRVYTKMKNNSFLPSRSFHLEEERDKLKQKLQ